MYYIIRKLYKVNFNKIYINEFEDLQIRQVPVGVFELIQFKQISLFNKYLSCKCPVFELS